jgi:hypothetical protein
MATINITVNPNPLNPVNKEIWHVFNSASSSISEFKYITRINYKQEPFDSSTPYIFGSQYKIPPRPITGDCEFSPHKYLRGLFEYSVEPYIGAAGYKAVNNNLTKYYLQYGYEYNPNLRILFTFNVSGNLGLFFTTAHGLTAGDVIRVTMDNQQINQAYNGTMSITGVPTTTAVWTNEPFGQTVSSEAGDVDSVYRIAGTTSYFEAFNGTRQYLENSYNFATDYIITGTAISSKKFLTEYPVDNYKPIQLTDWETLSCILGGTQNYSSYIELYSANDTLLNIVRKQIIAPNGHKRVDIGVGPENIILSSASASIFNNVSYYTVYIRHDIAATVRYRRADRPSAFSQVNYPSGSYNGRLYYTWSDPGSAPTILYMWWDNVNLMWKLSDGLGSGTVYVSSSQSSGNDPVDGSTPIQWQANTIPFGRFSWSNGIPVSEGRNYKVVSPCTLYDKYRICWMNRMGGYDYFNFNLDSKRVIDVARTEYTKTLSRSYAVGDRGDQVIATRADITYLINSDWITEEDSIWLESLITSPDVYHLDILNKLPIMVLDTNYETKTYLRNQIFNMQLNFRYAYRINLQNQ